MKFVVNDIAATPDAGGVYSILSDFYLDVLNHDKSNEWIFILAGKYFPESKNVKIIERSDLKRNKIKKFIFERFNGKKLINSLCPDVYISLQNISTYGIKARKQIVYLHQPIPFEKEKSFSFFRKKEIKLAVYQHLIGAFIKKSIFDNKPSVIVQTKWIKKAVAQQTKLSEKKIIIAHPRVEKLSDEEKKFHGDGKAFFYPASNYIYKNHDIIYKSIKILEKEGINTFKVYFTLTPHQLKFRDSHIEYLGHIPRKKVMKMYDTHVLIFPSFIESFGLPLIEAALHADIILAANTEFSKELLKDYSNVYYYDKFDSQKLAFLMKEIIYQRIKSDGHELDIVANGESILQSIKGIITKNDK